MATKGKRSIFQDCHCLKAQEANALEADILPGMLVSRQSTGFSKNTASATSTLVQPLFADYDQLAAGTVDEVWTQSENMVARVPQTDDYVNVRVEAGNNIQAIGTPLSAGTAAGYLKIAAAGDKVLAFANEVINVTANGLVMARGA